MRTAIRSVLVMSFVTWAITGCVGEPAPSAGLQAAEQSLQAKGVYYLQATGTAASPEFTFYDQNKVAIGDGRSSQDSQRTEIQWRDSSWENTGGKFSKIGAAGADGADAAELDTALSVFELSLDQAFPSTLAQIHPNACPARQPCSRPLHRCVGACTGFVCSQTDGSAGICINVH